MIHFGQIQKLSEFVEDYEATFWGGDGKIRFIHDDLTTHVTQKPTITFRGLREELKEDVVSVGGDLSASGNAGLTLGANEAVVIDLTYALDIDAWMHLVYSGRANVAGLKPLNLEDLLKEYIALSGDTGVLVLTAGGTVKGGVDGKTSFLSSHLDVGFELAAGGGYTWAYVMPFDQEQKVLAGIKESFQTARLPQGLKGQGLHFKNNELLLSRYTGFLKVGAQASFGYQFTGSDLTEDFAKPLDLKTKLTVQAQARLSAMYQLTGAFQVLVTDVKDPNRDHWVRVVVEKDRTSSFDIAFGVTVGVDFETANVPQSLTLFHTLLGTDIETVFKKALAYTANPEEKIADLKKKMDGFTQGIVEAWVGKSFDEVDDELRGVVKAIEKIGNHIQSGQEYLIGLYEHLKDEVQVEEKLKKMIELLEDDTLDVYARRDQLLTLVGDVWLKALLEHILDRTFGNIFTNLESVREEAVEVLTKLHALISGDAQEAVQKFVEAKIRALGLEEMFAEINQFASVDDLREQATEKIKELVGRLIDGHFDTVMHSSQAKRIFSELKAVSAHFDALLQKGDELIKKALNAKGRFELGWAYQHQHKNQKLIDVEIDVHTPKGQALYQQAIEANFSDLFQDENIPFIRVHSAVCTDTLFKQTQLNVHIFGWDFKETASMLMGLETSVQVGASGFITVYKMTVEGKAVQETSRRMTELRLLLQVLGTAKGAFEANDQMKKQMVDGVALLNTMKNSLTYTISDKLTSLRELESYFQLAVQMNMLSRYQLNRLIASLRELRALGMDDNNFGKVGVQYTFSFDTDALAHALQMDFSKEPDLIDEDPKRQGNVFALQNLFFDRLLASYYIGPNTNLKDYPLWAMFKDKIYKDIDVGFDPETWKNNKGQITIQMGGKKHIIQPDLVDYYHAEVIYRRIVGFAEFLDKFRKALTGEGKMSLESFGDLLKDFVKKLKKLNRQDFVLHALPMLVLNEMTRRGQRREQTEHTALLEITLYDKNNPEEAVHYIPIGQTKS